MDYYDTINDEETQQLLKNFSLVRFLVPRPIETQSPKPRLALDLLKELIASEDLQADATSQISESSAIPPKCLPISELKAESVPNLIRITDEIIAVEDDSDDEEIPQDSGIGTCTVSEVSNTDAIYAEPVGEFWEPPEITVNQCFLVPVKNNWIMARLTEKITERKFRLVEIKSQKSVVLHRKFLALAKPTDCLVEVGRRVIAKYRNFKETGECSGYLFKLGVVAETPNASNRFRYLVIFDTGVWLYVGPKNLRPIFHSLRHVWRQVPPENKKIVKNFLKGKLILSNSFTPGQMVKVYDKGGKSAGLHYCQVLSVDASLVLVWYFNLSQSEWIYKGSPRLKLI